MTDDTGQQFTHHDGAVTAGTPREDKAIGAARRPSKRLAKGGYANGCAKPQPGPMKTR